MGDVERLVDIGRGRQRVGRSGRRQEVRRGRRLADAAGARVGRAVIGEVEMDVVVVEHVRARPQDGGEIPAGPCVRLVEERGLLAVALLPVVDEIDRPPVGQGEARDVDRVAEGMLGELRAGDIVDGAATIGAEYVDGRDPLAETGLRVGLDDVVEPRLQGRDHRTIDGQSLVDRDRAIGERRDMKRTRHAANAWARRSRAQGRSSRKA